MKTNTTASASKATTAVLLTVTMAARTTLEAGNHLKAAVVAAVKALRPTIPEAKDLRQAVIDAALEALPAAKRSRETPEGKLMYDNVSKYLSQDAGVNVRGGRKDKGKKHGKGGKPAPQETEEKTPLTIEAIAAMIKSLAKKAGRKVTVGDLYGQLGDLLGC